MGDDPNGNVKEGTESNEKKVKEISIEEISKHDKATDIWVAINGKVYDLTNFLDDHPGGPDVVTETAGEDATDA